MEETRAGLLPLRDAQGAMPLGPRSPAGGLPCLLQVEKTLAQQSVFVFALSSCLSQVSGPFDLIFELICM